MTKNKRNLIILGSVLTAVYFAILTLGIHNGGKKTSGLDEVKEYQWPALINKLLAPFAPAVNLAKIECNGHPAQELFVLNAQQQSCTMELTPGLEGDEKFWKTEVRLSHENEQDLKVFIKVPYKDDPPSEKCETEIAPSPFSLTVEYTYDGQTGDNICWLSPDEKDQISLTVMKDEDKPTLTLSCVGCTEENRRKIKLKMK
ncbi:MAG: hypothetical protein SD837_21050 [Candidatus Electrothrix scaldis]|nr:MAG: hypothetical protein SD837_21050 [Candidatus Electrothrix sp. GW3-3]